MFWEGFILIETKFVCSIPGRISDVEEFILLRNIAKLSPSSSRAELAVFSANQTTPNHPPAREIFFSAN